MPAYQLRLTLLVALLAFAVILVGAYVRLSDAGLGCPDWPGCYGLADVPSSRSEIERANAAFPGRPVEQGKAWKEMIHRYLAGGLGLAILGLVILRWRERASHARSMVLPVALLGLVIFQAALGMWTVTLLVKPAIVTAHLLGGFAVLALLWLLALRSGLLPRDAGPGGGGGRFAPPLAIGILILLAQITLGGWTSSNYAALGCIEFPTCHSGRWWPAMDFGEAFVVWRGLGVDYQYGVLDGPARTAIHVTHRLGALLTLTYLAGVFVHLYRRSGSESVRRATSVAGILLAIQVALGIANVVGHLPLPVAVAHNGGAALLLLSLITLLWMTSLDARRGGR